MTQIQVSRYELNKDGVFPSWGKCSDEGMKFDSDEINEIKNCLGLIKFLVVRDSDINDLVESIQDIILEHEENENGNS